MARPVQYVFVAQDLAAICAYQTTGAAGDLVINGTYANGMQIGAPGQNAKLPGGFAYAVAINSSSNVSAVNFTVYGVDAFGQTVSNTVSGPNASVVYLTTRYAQVTRVAADAAVASNTRVGIGGNGNSRPWRVDTFMNPVSIDVSVDITATATASLQTSDADIEGVVLANGDTSTFNWMTISTVSNVTTDTIATVSSPHRWLRMSVSGANATGAVTSVLTQAGW